MNAYPQKLASQEKEREGKNSNPNLGQILLIGKAVKSPVPYTAKRIAGTFPCWSDRQSPELGTP